MRDRPDRGGGTAGWPRARRRPGGSAPGDPPGEAVRPRICGGAAYPAGAPRGRNAGACGSASVRPTPQPTRPSTVQPGVPWAGVPWAGVPGIGPSACGASARQEGAASASTVVRPERLSSRTDAGSATEPAGSAGDDEGPPHAGGHIASPRGRRRQMPAGVRCPSAFATGGTPARPRGMTGTSGRPPPRGGAVRGASYSALRSMAAKRPFCCVSISNWTVWPSFSVRKPARCTALMWTKMSLPPVSGAMNP